MNGSKRYFFLALGLMVLLSMACQLASGMGVRYNPEKETVQGSSGKPLSPSGGVPTRTLAAPAGGPGSLANAFQSGYTPAASLGEPLALRAPDLSQFTPTPTATLSLTPTLDGGSLATATPTVFPTQALSQPTITLPAAAPGAAATATLRPTATTGTGGAVATATPTLTVTTSASGAATFTPTATTGTAYPSGQEIPTNTPYPDLRLSPTGTLTATLTATPSLTPTTYP